MKNSTTSNSTNAIEITKGMIVSYTEPGEKEPGFYRVRKVTKNTVNLGSVFQKTLYYKSIPKEQVKEDSKNFYSYWRNTESYQCM